MFLLGSLALSMVATVLVILLLRKMARLRSNAIPIAAISMLGMSLFAAWLFADYQFGGSCDDVACGFRLMAVVVHWFVLAVGVTLAAAGANLAFAGSTK